MCHERRTIRRIAIINPLNDYGISGYTHEFAEGLAAIGCSVSVYSDVNVPIQDFPSQRHYELYPVLGKALLKQAALPHFAASVRLVEGLSSVPAFKTESSLNFSNAFEGTKQSVAGVPLLSSGLMPGLPESGGQMRLGPRKTASPAHKVRRQMQNWLRIRYLSSELALHLRAKKYDLVWTQWYEPDVFDSAFWRACNTFRLPVIHTVHNVLPHEPVPGDWERCEKIYAHSKLLVVHSNHSQAELNQEYPHHASKAIVMPQGTYSSLHKRVPHARLQVRQALGIAPDSPVLLFCGAIRPYKNIEAVIEGLAHPRFSNVTLVIAGKESKYPDSNANDPLQRTKALLAKRRIACRVKVIPRMLDTAEMSELFEASDILLLPYLKGYGSGLLLLGMTFGKHILATAVGGSDEYLQRYENHTLLEGSSAEDVAAGITKAVCRVRRVPEPAAIPAEFSWPRISATAMGDIEARLAA
ncbi:MAG TPA: glycosyltransferase family 4 protein [Bryobacteraceae bacterium]|jgi:glycosyltransferase involved in cell wall biosynthesis|nr:glycosyltransferase family 4 protein [Bryobacteraceae bacterium]